MHHNDPYRQDADVRPRESAGEKECARPQGCVSEDGYLPPQDCAGEEERPAPQGCAKEDEPPKPRKKKRRFGMLRLVLILLLLLLLALLFSNGLGLGGGFGAVGVMVQSGVSDLTEAAREAVEKAEPTAAPAAIVPLDPNEITVRQDAVLYMGETLTLAELRAALLENYREGEVTLVDEKAIKAAYDGVTGLLSELAIPYKAG